MVGPVAGAHELAQEVAGASIRSSRPLTSPDPASTTTTASLAALALLLAARARRWGMGLATR